MSTPTPDAEEDRPEASSGPWADWARAYREVAPYLDLGWRIVGAAAFPPLIGYGADLALGTVPWGVLMGAAVGLMGAVLQLRQVSDEMSKGRGRP